MENHLSYFLVVCIDIARNLKILTETLFTEHLAAFINTATTYCSISIYEIEVVG